MNMDDRQHRSILQKIAHRAMLERADVERIIQGSKE